MLAYLTIRFPQSLFIDQIQNLGVELFLPEIDQDSCKMWLNPSPPTYHRKCLSIESLANIIFIFMTFELPYDRNTHSCIKSNRFCIRNTFFLLYNISKLYDWSILPISSKHKMECFFDMYLPSPILSCRYFIMHQTKQITN